jgi:hypothetical protein
LLRLTSFFFLFFYSATYATVIPKHLVVHADTMPKEFKFSHKLISAYLVKETKSESEKILIFSYWIAKNIKYDLSELKRLGYNKTPQETLLNKRGVCGCFSNLFQQFCTNEGVKSFVVSGEVKGWFIKRIFSIYHLRHAWNVVYVDGKWQLVDVTWLISDIKSKAFKKEFDLSWVFMSPKDFIKSHYPKSPVWQLLDYPISLKEFRRKKRHVPKENDPIFKLKNSFLLDSTIVFASNYLVDMQYEGEKKSRKYFKAKLQVYRVGEFHSNDTLEIRATCDLLMKLKAELDDSNYFFRKEAYRHFISRRIELSIKMEVLYKEEFVSLVE